MMTSKAQGKTSVAWRLFNVNENDASKVTCRLCENVISRGGKSERHFTTTNMIKHLRTHHKEELEKEEIRRENEKKRKVNHLGEYFPSLPCKKMKTGNADPQTPGTSQLTMQDTLNLNRTWDIDNPQSQKIHKIIGEMIALDLQPFSVVEDTWFFRLMKHLRPCYVLPSRSFFVRNIIPDMQSKMKIKIAEILSTATNISFTTDIWTNNAETSFIR